MKAATSYGPVEGICQVGVYQFLGIPYAAPPVGALRFRPPQPPAPWTNVRSCRSYGPAAPQFAVKGLALLQEGERISEDCLYLNITTPGCDGKKRPVLFWIHGGAFQKGSASVGLDPIVFAKQGIVVVSINYRLGVLGFLDVSSVFGEEYRSSGNNGILDVLAALRFVRKNIEAFGGDPENITVMGQSAGAKLAASLQTSPLVKGLFSKAICCSGAAQTLRDRQTAAAVSASFFERLSARSIRSESLLTLPWKEIIEYQKDIFYGLNLHIVGPVCDDYVFTNQDPLASIADFSGNPVPTLLGTNRDEIELYCKVYEFTDLTQESAFRLFGNFAPAVLADYQARIAPLKDRSFHDAFVHFMTEYIYRAGTIQLARALAAANQAAYVYRLDWDRQSLKACHASESQFLMDMPMVITDMDTSPEHDRLGRAMKESFLSFIRSGVPASALLPDWPVYDLAAPHMMRFDAVSEAVPIPPLSISPAMGHTVFSLDLPAAEKNASII